MERMLDLGCNERWRGHCAGDEAQPIGAVRMSESTRASPGIQPAPRIIPAQDAGPEGRVARGAKPSCSLTRRPALSVERGMRNEMGEA